MSDREEPRYIRFTRPPRGGRSKTHMTGALGGLEQGVSVYPGELIAPDLFRINTGCLFDFGLIGLIARAAQDAPAFFVAGEEVGEGIDGEPLLRVEDIRRVPRSTSVTSVDTAARPALKLWSAGPRDSSGARHVLRRLQGGAYSPEVRFSAAEIKRVRASFAASSNPFGPPKKRNGRR